jgi:hypothetical protein
MAHGMARKLTRAAALSFLVFATTSGVAGLEVLAASPAMAQPDQPSPFAPPAQDQPQPQPADPAPGNGSPDKPANPGGGLVPDLGGLTGGLGGLAGGGGSGSSR